MLKSWMHVHNRTQRVIIVDNSTNDETKNLLDEHKVPYITRPGMSHGNGVNEALRLCKTKYALLVDTDVIFTQDHSSIFKQFKK
jgi:GTP:adenosylcobinamide-phosphate guanylyltransferase